ncbi:transglutaminase [Candidatus Kaiserbacteria bacterium RIFCSPHIGHO2_01_FULL_55_17]|uniref:Transglutaminase n=1 Tax=Candidatus Kaiserbacteria bacterium RIFCSPHIGHO2_01_FULL_55_17 TaxID=1798484 RepID=A0A1F6DAN3_9BACT|nr:MAG: transglutaminase [Candidatus Kaiserbacteria bacterium RIFCSPHIGHO2_01_FULL_55_17]
MRIRLLVALMLALGGQTEARAAEQPRFISVGAVTRAPIGWTDFCLKPEYAPECQATTSQPRDVVLTRKAWQDLALFNALVNDYLSPMTDLEHWGVVERWNYPDDGYGDCEDYVLEKRRLLMLAGWPRSALLITVVRDKNGDGHAVLTVRTNRGEFVLDSLTREVLPWHRTGYRFVKRQLQSDPNVWVALGGPPTEKVGP